MTKKEEAKQSNEVEAMLKALGKTISESPNVDETISFNAYLERVKETPWITRNTHQLIHDMIQRSGVDYTVLHGQPLSQNWKFFTDKNMVADYVVFGQGKAKENLLEKFSNASKGMEASKRLWILLGPPGSAKSRSMEAIKTALNSYTRSDEGVTFTVLLPTVDERLKSKALFTEDGIHYLQAPCFEKPFQIIPKNLRKDFFTNLNASTNKDAIEDFCSNYPHYDGEFNVRETGLVSPYVEQVLEDFQRDKGIGFMEMLKFVKVKRMTFDAKSKTGIGSYTPRDEKSQEAGSLVGNIDYSLLPSFGSESHPLVHDYKGELCVGANGFVEIHECLKLSEKFLYELLFATQDRFFKPEGQPPIPFNGVIIGHTNYHEYNMFSENATFEALRSRTNIIEMPLSVNFLEEEKIYDLTYSNEVRNWTKKKKHIAHVGPFVFKLMSLAGCMTRMYDTKAGGKTDLLQKALIHAGRADSGLDSNMAKSILEEFKYHSPSEGTFGLDPRFMQNLFEKSEHSQITEFNANIAEMLKNEQEDSLFSSLSLENPCVTPMDVFKHFEVMVKTNLKKNQIERYETKVLPAVKKWVLAQITSDVYSAILKDDTIVENTWKKYTEHARAYTTNQTVRREATHEEVQPDEKFMQSIEKYLVIHEKDTFRKELTNAISATNYSLLLKEEPGYQDAIKKFVFENEFQSKENMKLLGWIKSGQSSASTNSKEQDKLNETVNYLIEEKGYCGKCALQALTISANASSIS
jgi:serine protein kinase